MLGAALFATTTFFGATPVVVNASPINYAHTLLTKCNGLDDSCFEILAGETSNPLAQIAYGSFSEKGFIYDTAIGDGSIPILSTYTYSAKAQSTDEGLKAFVSADVFNEIASDASGAVDPGATSYLLEASADYQDTLSVAGADDLTSIEFDLNIHGTISPYGNVYAQVYEVNSGIFFNIYYDENFSSTDFDLTMTGNLDVVSGFVDIDLNLYTSVAFLSVAQASAASSDDIPSPFGSLDGLIDHLDWSNLYVGGGTADFFNTVTIGQFRGHNAAGELVNLTGVTGSGGKIYEALHIASPVPEPETYAMLLAGLGLLGFVAHRKQKNIL